MNSAKDSDARSAHCEGMEPNLPSPVAAAQNAPAADADSAAAAAILQGELATQKGDYLRLAADFDNFRKRTRRDSEQRAAAEKEAFISELLPILDNLERALTSEQAISAEGLHQGVAMTLQQLGQLLQKHGIEVVEDLGHPFDPHRHEAVSVRHDPHQLDRIILEVTQRGYVRGDRVFRPAKVIVNDLSYFRGPRHAG